MRRTAGEAVPGRVLLVGAGPGDPELLTLKALRALRRASVVLVDDLVSDAVLRLAPRRARVVHVGKRGGCAGTPQQFIERLMVAEARNGETVVRLKGGDPAIFGRSGEEAAALRAHGVPVEVVNGITAGLAAATAIGAPLTHRDHAHGVIIVTGHARSGSATLHWPTLASAAAQGLTLVVYMGVASAAELQHGLLQGLPAQTPVALVQNASLASQRDWRCTLADLAATIRREQVASPAVIVVGDVLHALHDLAARGEAQQRVA
jgi:uroporphyrin-III C-methyltransferase